MTTDAKPLDLAEVRSRLASVSGPEYWRSLEELAQTPAFRELVERELPQQAGPWSAALDRRHFLGLLAASLGLAGLSGCAPLSPPQERIVPYVRPPEQIVPGRPLWFATTMPLVGDALGLLVESHEGRPTKVEGNPSHPSSPRAPGSPTRVKFGASSVLAQASILTMYDPDRSTGITHLGENRSWEAFLTAFLQTLRSRGGNEPAANFRLRVLTETVTSPSLAWQLKILLRAFPQAQWHVYDSIDKKNARDGARLAFGETVAPQYLLDRADVILSLDADFLNSGPSHVRLLHDFAQRRRVRTGQPMNRLYVVESMPSGTGTLADHRLPMRSVDVEAFARALAHEIDPQRFPALQGSVTMPSAAWLAELANDLKQHREKCLVIAGEGQSPVVHAIAHALNDTLGNVGVGKTVTYTVVPEYSPPADRGGSIGALATALDVPNNVDMLLVIGCNPMHTAPPELRFGERMSRVPFRVHFGLYHDETAELCHWHLPEAHFLESWGDARSADGTVSFIQPLIAPLHHGKTAGEVLSHLSAQGIERTTDVQDDRSSYSVLRSYWRSLFDNRQPAHQEVRADWQSQGLLGAFTGSFETWWQRSLRDGVVAQTQLPAKTLQLRTDWPAYQAPAGEVEIVFQPDPALYDGRFANNGWLRELPRPPSKLTWDNAAYISAATAIQLGFASADHPEEANEKVVELVYHGKTVEAPLWVVPGHADQSVTVYLGYGRRAGGRVATTHKGFDSCRLRTDNFTWFGTGLALRFSGRRHPLACTQHHQLMEGRDIVRSGTVQNPPPMPAPERLTLYNDAEHQSSANQWAMVINLSVCTGCSACVVACQAENNIPVVGKDQVTRGRAMHWLRIDRYHKGEPANPEMFYQPVPCMHCENAPCEQVCPVAATVHSSDGLNDMVYNRCVGTRYCSNNCPYKVRRFNFLQYADFTTESLRLMRNPEVTVRSRGVMEKCTYCVQRIRTGQIAAQIADPPHPVRDGEVVTACQAACPAGAIVFGDKNDQAARVRGLRQDPLHYGLLDEVNTRPRTTYLAALKNPNSAMPPRQ
jgi:molybdopterin-containing oxidoreductase family iron-sulfur binding subunit